MSFFDNIRAWLKGETKQRKAPSKSTAAPSGESVKDLEEFIASRTGVEGYLEPKTAIYSTTLLLVAADGEYIRRPVKDRNNAEKVCTKHSIPLYDAGIVGYPKRMRQFDQGEKPRQISLDDLPPWPGDDGSDAPPPEAT